MPLTSERFTSYHRPRASVQRSTAMPFIIRKQGSRWCVYTKGADGEPKGDTHGCHATEAEAQAQMRALYVHVPEARKDEEDGALVAYGGAVKALGGGRIGGYVVRFSTERDPDLSEYRDFFSPETDFDLEDGTGKASVYYAHGLDPTLQKRRLGKAILKADEAGIWGEAQIALRDAYDRKIYELAQAGKLAWSSASTTHLVERKAVGDAHHIDHWPIAEVSLTPTPAEPRCGAVALKSLSVAGLDLEPAERHSLAELTERWLDNGEDLLARYGQVKQMEAKIGRPISAARRARLAEMVRLGQSILDETQMEPRRDAAVRDSTAPAMGASEATSPAELLTPDMYAQLVQETLSSVSIAGWDEGPSV